MEQPTDNHTPVPAVAVPVSEASRLKPVDMLRGVALLGILLGVGLFKWGFLTGSWSREKYRKVALIGYGIGLPLVIYSYYYSVAHYPTLEAGLRHMEAVSINWVGLIYPFQRILLVLAHTDLLASPPMKRQPIPA